MKNRKYYINKIVRVSLAVIFITGTLHNGLGTVSSVTLLPTEVKAATEINITPSPEITITPMLDPTVTPTPDLTITPTPTITPDLTITPTPDITITPTPEITITPVPTITPTPVPAKFIPDTLQRMANYDYIGNSVTGISKEKSSVQTLQSYVKAYGKLYGTGMPYGEYIKAMSNQWKDATEYDRNPSKVKVDLTKSMDYASYVDTLKKLSRYDGVYLYKIGRSTQGRDLYAIEIDMKSNIKKDVYMLTGQVHAREFAGGTFIVKQFAELIMKAQTDKKTMDFLKKHKFVAVPIINVDGREALIKGTTKWNGVSGGLLKAYMNGTDGNRNFPGLQWGQVANGNRRRSTIESKPTYANYPGSYAGSNNETKAMMKWLYHYIVVEKAVNYLDLHQQGSIVYAGKSWQTTSQAQKSFNLRSNFLNLINSGVIRRKYTKIYETSTYGMQGEGTSLTDYAVTLAVGAKFSPAYGFSAFPYKSKEYILMQIKDLDRKIIPVTPANNNFSALTVEIGYGVEYLGNSYSTRLRLAKEYQTYHYGKLLESLPKISGKY